MNGMDMLRVGVFSSAFAPVHKGHVAAAKAFMEQMKLDYLFIVPTYMDKSDASDDPLYRLKMCELAFSEVDGIIISDAEILKGGRSYTYDTLSELKRPDARLFLLCETDAALSFDKLYKYEDVLKLC
jgi:nicotinate-nucleotide adenylyltransferase